MNHEIYMFYNDVNNCHPGRTKITHIKTMHIYIYIGSNKKDGWKSVPYYRLNRLLLIVIVDDNLGSKCFKGKR